MAIRTTPSASKLPGCDEWSRRISAYSSACPNWFSRGTPTVAEIPARVWAARYISCGVGTVSSRSRTRSSRCSVARWPPASSRKMSSKAPEGPVRTTVGAIGAGVSASVQPSSPGAGSTSVVESVASSSAVISIALSGNSCSGEKARILASAGFSLAASSGGATTASSNSMTSVSSGVTSPVSPGSGGKSSEMISALAGSGNSSGSSYS